MPHYKDEKLAEVIRSLAAEFLQKESSGTSLITVTRVAMSNKGKNSQVLFTVFPETKESAVIEFTKRRAHDFREYVKSHVQTRIVPFFRFELDLGEKNRQHIDVLSNKSEI